MYAERHFLGLCIGLPPLNSLSLINWFSYLLRSKIYKNMMTYLILQAHNTWLSPSTRDDAKFKQFLGQQGLPSY